MSRPKLNIENKPVDYLLDIASIMGVLTLVGLPFFYYDVLPAEVPSHFGSGGDADNYSDKTSIFLMPVIGFFLFLLLFILSRFPHLFNYPVKITEENAPRLYLLGQRMLRLVNFTMILSFIYINYATIQTALNNMNGLGQWFMPVFLVIVIGPVLVFTVMMFRSK